jgi:hypothetical protein
LVFPGGSEIGLEIHRALGGCKEITLFSAAMDIPNHAPYVFRRHFILPNIHEPDWVEKLNMLVQQLQIDFIYPAHDDVILALAENAERIRARLIQPPLETCRITRSKSTTYRHFEGVLPVPTIYERLCTDYPYPVFIKPDRGQGSERTVLASNSRELEVAIAKDETALILEYLPGEEVTVDCFSSREQGVLFCGGRRRVRTKSGISMATSPVDDPIFALYASAIFSHLEIYGAWFYQLKRDPEGKYKLLEIGPRIAGSMALHRVMGVNFPLLSIYEHDRVRVSIAINEGRVEMERALTNRYRHNYKFTSVYIDLDDTLILGGKVNLNVIRFIFQCVNQGVPLRLLTRHVGEIGTTLARHRLSGLFDQVLTVGTQEDKAEYILEPDAILLDDSFSERCSVARKCNIRTFDSSMIEVLLDERI